MDFSLFLVLNEYNQSSGDLTVFKNITDSFSKYSFVPGLSVTKLNVAWFVPSRKLGEKVYVNTSVVTYLMVNILRGGHRVLRNMQMQRGCTEW